MATRLGVLVSAVALAIVIGLVAIGPDWRRALSNPPLDRNVLFWSLEQRDAGFRLLDRAPFIAKARVIAAKGEALPLPEGAPLAIETDIDAFMESQRAASLIIIHNGNVRLERYGLGFSKEGRWTSFSVAKSLTAMLIGVAIADGHIGSVDDPVTDYVPELKGSAYEGVTVAQVLTMTSGVAWNENYEDPASDVANFDRQEPEDGRDPLASYMAELSRAHPPGEVWNYSTGETNLVGLIVARATGRDLSTYLSEKIWTPFGMEADSTWLLGQGGGEIGGCCIQATTRDFARFGLYMLAGAPGADTAYAAAAVAKGADIGDPGRGYGYQWWTFDDGAYQADGIFGQGVFIDPARNLVIATNGNWRSALGLRDGEWPARLEFYRSVQAAIDAE